MIDYDIRYAEAMYIGGLKSGGKLFAFVAARRLAHTSL